MIKRLPRPNVANPEAAPVEVLGTFGDIFEPDANARPRSYDVIVVSATLNPLYKVDDDWVWESNLLVRSALQYASSDPSLLEPMFKSVVVEMQSRNREFLQQFTRGSSETISARGEYVASLCEPLFMRTAKGSQLLSKGVRWIAIVPIFDSRDESSTLERQKKLKLNVAYAIGRVVTDLQPFGQKYGDYGIRGVALPAIAASEHLRDSSNYLTYEDSYEQILGALSGRERPTSIERFYLVAWNKWEVVQVPEEGAAALDGLASVKYANQYNEQFVVAIGYAILASVAAAYVFVWFLRSRVTSIGEIVRHSANPVIVFVATGLASALGGANTLSACLKWAYGHGGGYASIAAELVLSVFAVAIGRALANAKAEAKPPARSQTATAQ